MSPLGPSLQRIRSLDRGHSEFDIASKKRQNERQNAQKLRSQIVIRKTKQKKAEDGQEPALEQAAASKGPEPKRKTRSLSNFGSNRPLE
jgi:hypothetical protein